MNVRKLRFPILIGIGVIGAGILLYQATSRIDSQHTQGAIGQRDVYRNGQVSAADVKANPGSAPVAAKVLMESKEFKALAKNEAFQGLLANQSFQALSQNSNFLNLLQNPSFFQLQQNQAFVNLMQNGSVHSLYMFLQSQGMSQSLNSYPLSANLT